MLIKEIDERDHDLAELNALLNLPHVSQNTKNQIQQTIGKIQSGLKGEKEAAYHINFYYENTKNWAVIHDLRLEVDGYSAQIDHLLIDRFLEIYVCESKRFREGIGINEHGEFYSFTAEGKPYGIPSPIEQNNRHKSILKRLFDSDEITLPTRLRLKMKPSLHSLILIANTSSIRRPKNSKNVDDLDRIIKVEQLRKRIEKDIFDNRPSALVQQFASAAKIISSDTLQDFAEDLASLHKPLKIDWKARFGISDTPPAINVRPPSSKPSASVTPASVQPTTQSASQLTQPQRLFCAACQKTVSQNVANFCWNNKAKFHGKVYCYDCQRNVNHVWF